MKRLGLALVLILSASTAFAQSYYGIRQGDTVHIYSDQVRGQNSNNSVGWVTVPSQPVYPKWETTTDLNLRNNNVVIRNRTGSFSNHYKVFDDDSGDDD